MNNVPMHSENRLITKDLRRNRSFGRGHSRGRRDFFFAASKDTGERGGLFWEGHGLTEMSFDMSGGPPLEFREECSFGRVIGC